MRTWGVVKVAPHPMAKRYEKLLRIAGYRAKAMFNLAKDAWEVCVSPAEQADKARVTLQMAERDF